MEKWYTPYEVLKMATHDNAQLLKLSGPRYPYPGELGVVKEGALADLILVNGNPLENLDLVADPDKNFVVIIRTASSTSTPSTNDICEKKEGRPMRIVL